MNVAAPDVAARAGETWMDANQRALTRALDIIRGYLDQRGASAIADTASAGEPGEAPAIDLVAATFGLTHFERNVLLLCAGVELDTAFAASCAAAQPGSPHGQPTFSLALSVLPGAHWSALSPGAPLRRFRLIELGDGNTLTGSPLRIDERVLHHLVGEAHLDERLAGLLEPVRPDTVDLAPSQQAVASQIAAAWARVPSWASAPVMQLAGADRDGKRAVAAAAAAGIGASLYALPAHLIGLAGDEALIARLLTREAALGGAALLIDCQDIETGDSQRSAVVSRLLDRIAGPLLVMTREPGAVGRRQSVVFDVARPTTGEQRALWRGAIQAAGLAPRDAPGMAPAIDRLVSQFDLGAGAIKAACVAAGANAAGDPGAALWDACRSQARPRMDDLAQRIDGAADWDDLVLPDTQRNVLREIAIHVRQRAKVYETWGFAAKGSRGLGVSALFTGPSGTGKTMAAEVLARALRLDLYRIDLSSMVSKYIGETEKNLRRVFDAAEQAAAILLFDEADAIFGKRSEVKDSHDRYANMEVSYLLQRMEAYRGLAILTTNMKSAIDTAFLRRIRFVVQFPFPDPVQRAAIWGRVFPPDTPTEGLDMRKLSRLNVAGGNIRNIAINAAFLAAEAGGPVTMTEVMQAARSEYGKLERPMTRELEE